MKVNRVGDNLAELKTKLDQATEAYLMADERASAASREATAALIRMNDAQKAFDAGIAEIRKNAPTRSDWSADRHRVSGESA